MALGSLDGAQFDYIVVGGGSAGCIMAARLSERRSSRVLLIEAGQDFAPGAEPRAMRDPAAPIFFQPDYFQPMTGEGDNGAPVMLMQARVMGGGSSVNGMHAQRGEPADYDEWRQLGVTGWGWTDVFPYFKNIETDLDFSGPAHGGSGPIKIKRQGPETWSELSLGVARLLEKQGIPRVADLNDLEGPGYGPVPLNATESRMSSAAAYLTAEVRARANLTIRSNTSVRRILFDEAKVRGIELENPARETIGAANVIVSCGVYLSPELLLRSGIGPAQALAEAAIPLVADRPGVGQNLQAHVLINLFAHLAAAGRSRGKARAPCLLVARLSSKVPSCPPSDLILNIWERSPGSTVDNPLHRQFADLQLVLNKAYSVGDIKLDPGNPFGPAKVRPNMLADRRDLDRMVEGFRYLVELASDPSLEGVINDVFAMKPDPAAFALFQDTFKARMMSRLGAIVLGGPASLRKKILKDTIIPVHDLVNDPVELEAQVRRDIGHTHATGTCALGDPSAPMTVVDEHCRVVGVEGLRVVDASIFPRSMRAGTNLPTMMGAEKAAQSILQGH